MANDGMGNNGILRCRDRFPNGPFEGWTLNRSARGADPTKKGDWLRFSVRKEVPVPIFVQTIWKMNLTSVRSGNGPYIKIY